MEDEDTKDEVDSKVVKRTRFRRAVLTVLARINSTNHHIQHDVPDTMKNHQPSASSTPAPIQGIAIAYKILVLISSTTLGATQNCFERI